LITLLKNCLHWGCDAAANHSLKRKILHANITALITILTMLLFAGINSMIGNPALIESNLLAIPFYFTAAAVPWLNRRGHFTRASWLLSLSLPVSIAVMTWAVYGSRFGLHYYFILFAMLSVTFFPLRQWLSILAVFTLNAALFLYCEFAGVSANPALQHVDDALAGLMRLSFAGSVMFSIFILVWVGEFAADRNERELESLSGTDALTRLPNRRRLHQRLVENIAISKRTGQYGAVLFIDLDNFKPLNDRHGHGAGDLLLQEAAQRIIDCVREVDVVARYGGDEFVVILGHLGHESEHARSNAHQTAEKVRELLGKPYELAIHVKDAGHKRVEHSCTSSIGVALFAGAAASEEHILKCADAAMYRAKGSGRNAIRFHHGIHA
jgi:diguanylate cyclase (GGDEF)-like protein